MARLERERVTHEQVNFPVFNHPDSNEEACRVCASCHGANEQDIDALRAWNLAVQNGWSLLTQLENCSAGYRGTHPEDTCGQQMISIARIQRNEAAIRKVVAHINTLSGE